MKRGTYDITTYNRIVSRIIQYSPIKYGNEKYNRDITLFKFRVENSTKQIYIYIFPNNNVNILHMRNHQK